jgi:transcriptional regulator with XRE-family HTH domain
MKLGQVIKMERERKSLAVKQVALDLGIELHELEGIEQGDSLAEEWGPKLTQIAIALDTPTSRLISRNGKSDEAAKEKGQCGTLIRAKREARGLSQQDFANLTQMPIDEVSDVEDGTTPLEVYGPLFLRFAELIEQPVFNLFFPCGIPFQEYDGY